MKKYRVVERRIIDEHLSKDEAEKLIEQLSYGADLNESQFFKEEQEDVDEEDIEEEGETREEEFTRKAKELLYEVKRYSGRGMFGRECPSVVVDKPEDFIAEMGMKGLKIDNMGLDYVVYTG